MRVALAQIDPTVGDIKGNGALVVERMEEARRLGAEMIVFPELAISGYPPEDLLLKDHFVSECAEALDEVAAAAKGIAALVGIPVQEGEHCYNAARVLCDGAVAAEYRKILLPNYGVFDEKRYFTAGDTMLVVEVGAVKVAVTICEDIWIAGGPGEVAVRESGASVIVNLSMSPYHMGKGLVREKMLGERATAASAYVCYANGVGGQDELVFDGQSVVLDPEGRLIARAAQFEEELLVVDLAPSEAGKSAGSRSQEKKGGAWSLRTVELQERKTDGERGSPSPNSAADADSGAAGSSGPRLCEALSPEGEVYAALLLGVRDYTSKNGFSDVVIGVSGGIDSALTATIAADALGRERVHAVSMPSRYSSKGTKTDAREVAERLGADYLEIAIEEAFGAYLDSLGAHIDPEGAGVTVQNIQARIRGNILMALSNENGWLVLTTGNKSETAVGYATLYGDMAGGFAVLKDVPKTLVYELARYRNGKEGGAGPIPETTISRAPSAELAADQTDQDTLPPYDVLDRIIESYVVLDESVEEMVAAGLDESVVLKVIAMIDGNEYKRRQAAPGVRITPKAFGKDRRLPITNRYRG